jgi:Conserved TM helix
MLTASISDSLQRTSDEFFAWLPKLVGALVILLIGWFIARLVSRIVRRALQSAGADKALATGRAGTYKQQFAPSLEPSGVIATVVFWFIFGWAILLAISTLGIQALQDAVANVVAYLPNVVAAILILLVAVAVAGAIGGLAARLAGGTMLARLVQTIVPTLVITIALFMALVQLKIATQIVVATYVLVLGAIALGFALAFGLGGRDVAGQMLQAAYASGQDAMPRLRQEAQQAKEQGAEDVERLKDKLPDAPDDTPDATPPAGGGTRPPRPL